MRKVVSQDSSVHSCLSLKVGALFLSMLLCTSAIATPVGGIIDGGEAVITHPNSVTTNINQTTNRASINWQEFNVYDGETVNFIQLDSNSITLNRVQGGLGASQIYGTINSNGHVWILNPEGVHFRAGSSVNVAGVLASTYNIATQNFMDGNYQFERFPGNHNSYAKNAGDLRVTSLAALLSHDVETSVTFMRKRRQ